MTRRLAASDPPEQPKLPPEAQLPWPDWYGILYMIPGFRVPLPEAQAWLDKQGLSEWTVETLAYELKSKWPGPKNTPYRDAWATFQAWCRKHQGQHGNGHHPTDSLQKYRDQYQRLNGGQQ